MHERHAEALGEGLGAVLMDTFFSASILEVLASAGGSVTGRNVRVAVSGHGQTGVCGWNQQPAMGLPYPG